MAHHKQSTSLTNAGPIRENLASLIAKGTNDRDFVASLARGLAVMLAFSRRRQQLTVSQISAQIGISRAAVRRSLLTLVKLGLAGTHDEQHYFLCPKVQSLSQAYFTSTPIASVAQPVLERLSAELSETCSIGVLDGNDVAFVARAAVARIMSADLQVGSRLAAFCSSMGRVLLAGQPDDRVAKYLDGLTLTQYTNKTVDSIAKFRRILESARQNGYALVDQELEIGLRALAVPIRNSSNVVVAALNVACPAQRVNVCDLQTTFLPHLRKAAQIIGSKL